MPLDDVQVNRVVRGSIFHPDAIPRVGAYAVLIDVIPISLVDVDPVIQGSEDIVLVNAVVIRIPDIHAVFIIPRYCIIPNIVKITTCHVNATIAIIEDDIPANIIVIRI